MSDSKNRKAVTSQTPNLVFHKAHCTVCAHPKCAEIEHQFVMWESAAEIATEFKLKNRSSIYRHANALGLFSQRDQNLRMPLGRLIERVDEVELTAGAVVQAIALQARINAKGELVERDERISFQAQFEKMTLSELDAYAKDGTVPSWFPRVKDTKSQQGGDKNE